MNKPIVIGQTTEFSAQRNAPARVIKLAKPDGGQAYTVTLGYDQNFKLDLSGIANEKITLVHVGERLIILFDNQSTLTINPFYDSANAILGNISFDVGDARVIDGTQFAGIFPITEDQSVLPAAGEGGPQAGANFRDASVDPLSTPDPLDLLPPEELGNFVINDIIGRNDDTIEPLRFLGLRLIVEEDQLGHGEVGLFPALSDGNEGPTSFNHETGAEDDFDNDPSTVDGDDDSWNDLDNTTQQFKAQLVVTGGSGNHVYSLLSLADYNSSFKSQGEVIRVHIDNATGVLTGYVDQGAAGLGGDDRVVFTLQLTTAGQVTFTIYDQLDHPSLDGLPGDNEENNLLMDLSGLIIVSDTVTLQSLALTDVIVTIIDDVPVLTGRKDIVVVDEDDIKTLHDGLPGGSLGTHPNDGNGDGSYTGDSWNNAGGPATVTGSLKDLVRIGADEWPTQEKPSEGGGSENPMPAFVPLSSLNGPFNFKDGEDTDLSYLQNLGLSSKGGPLSYDIQDNVLYGFVNVGQPGVVYNEGFDRLVFKLTLETDSDYKFELYDQLDHDVPPFGADQNYDLQDDVPGDIYFIDFGNLISVTDFDGDSIGLDGKLLIKVRDDVPELIPCDPIVLRVDEDDIRTNLSLGTSPNDGNADGSYTGNPSFNQPGPANVSGSLQGPGGVVVSGADEPLTFSFTGNAKSYFTNLGLSSKGEELSYHIQDGVLYGYVNKQFEGPFGPNDRIVFKFTLENDGDFKFELFDQLDHDLGNGQNYDLQDDVPGDVMWLEFGDVIKATDYDGDSVVLKDMLKIKVKDDVPEVAPCDPIVLTVDEDDIKTVNFTTPTNVNPGSTGTSPNDSNADGSYTGNPANNNPGPAFVSGSLASVVQSGADEKLTFSFISESSLRSYLENLGLQSQGAELSYDLSGNTLYAFDNAGNSLGQTYDSGQDRLVFTLQINPATGEFEFKLYDQLDHDAPPSGADQNLDLQDDVPGDLYSIDFGSILKATDYDGDSVVLANLLKIQVRDDVPKVAPCDPVVFTVDEDDIKTIGFTTPSGVNPGSLGTSPNDSNADGSYTGNPANNNPGPAFVSGSLASVAQSGADEKLTFSFISENSLRSVLEGLGLTSQGGELSYDLQGNILYAFENAGSQQGTSYDVGQDRLVFTFEITNPQTGEFEFKLYDQLDHDAGNGQNFPLEVPGNDITYIDFGSVLKATDYDGDSVDLDGMVKIKVHDDVPELSANLNQAFKIVHDESANVQGEDDDVGSLPAVFAGFNDGQNNNDPHVGANPIGYASSDVSVFTNIVANYGADEGGSLTYSLQLKNGASSIATGLSVNDVDGDPRSVTLFKQGNYIVGRFDYTENADGSNDSNSVADDNDPVAFVIGIDASGKVHIIQYLSVNHPTADPDEIAWLVNDAVQAVLNIEDYDHDKQSVTVNIGDKIGFSDDGPTAHISPKQHAEIRLDETVNGGDDNNDGNPFDGDAIASRTVSGSSLFVDNSTYGADGPKDSNNNGNPDSDAKVFSLQLNGGNGTPSGLQDARNDFPVLLSLVGGVIEGRANGALVFTISIDPSDGDTTVTQYRAVEHDNPNDHDENSSPEIMDSGLVEIKVTVRDDDGDTSTDTSELGALIKFEDDGPVVKVEANHYKEADDIKVALDETTPFGFPDDNTPATEWVASTTVNPANAIGRVLTPTSNNGISVADLFKVSYNAGSDNLQSITHQFGLTLKDHNGNVVPNGSGQGIETTMRVTDVNGGPLDMSAAARTIWLFKQADGSILGVIGQNSGVPGDEYVALRMYLTGGSDPQLVVEQYLPIEHPTGGAFSPDEAVALFLADKDAGVEIAYTVTVTDKDGDSASSTHSIEIIDKDDTVVCIEDDGPSITVTPNGQTGLNTVKLNLDETVDPTNDNLKDGDDRYFGVEPADNNGDLDDVSNGGGSFNKVPVLATTLTLNPSNAIGRLETGAGAIGGLFTVTANTGTDHGTVSHAFTFVLSGPSTATNLVVTALDATALETMDAGQRTISLISVSSTVIEGRIPGTGAAGDEYVAFRITLENAGDPATAKIVVDQFLPIDHGADATSIFDEVLNLLLTDNASFSIKDTVTVTDFDGDTATSSSTVKLIDSTNSFISFDDDGPAPVALAASNTGFNGLFFDNFVTNNNAWGNGSGVATGTSGGWTLSPSNVEGAGTPQLEKVADLYRGADSPTGSVMVDMEATPGNMQISQSVTLTAGETHKITFEAGMVTDASLANTAILEVWFDGVLLGTIVPTPGLLQTYSYDVIGNGAPQLLVFKEIGDAGDNTGTYLANVKVTDIIVVDETEGHQADSDEVPDLSSIFTSLLVVNQGIDLDMPTQYAQGSAAIVAASTADYGTDGPAATNAKVITLSTSSQNVNSGLKTTAGDPIYLRTEGKFVVGRYETDGVDGISVNDAAAFALTVDPVTGILSMAQFVSLEHPTFPATHDEPVFLNNGTVLATVTLTDGDGDTVSSSVDVSSLVRFDDDGPVVTSVTKYQGTGDNLVVNGGFEQGHGLNGQQWNIYQQVPGVWTWGDNKIPFELQHGGAAGFPPPGDAPNNVVVELDGDTVGSGLPPQGTPDLDDTNATIQQVVAGTQAGQPYELTFYYAPRNAGETSGMQVTFGGNVVWTSAGSEAPAGVWQKITIIVVAPTADAILAFTGTGTEDEFGALLDNVSLKLASNVTLDDEDLTGGIQGIVANGDDGQGLIASGKVNFDAGSDGLKSISIAGFEGLKAIYVDPVTGVGHLRDVNMTWDANTKTLTGVAANIGTVFTLSIDNSGNYVFTLKAPIAHEPPTDPASYENNKPLDFVVTVTDGDNDTATGTISINVDDDIPVAASETTPLFSVEEGDAATIIGTVAGLLANDAFGADGKHATNPISITSPGSLGGTITINGLGQLVYTPPANVNADTVETFTYAIKDGDGDTSEATFKVTVTNDTVPTGGQAYAVVDDDGLLGGNALSTNGDYIDTDADGDNNEATFSGFLGGNVGLDVPGIWSLAGMAGSNWSLGQNIGHYEWDAGNNTLKAVIDGTSRNGLSLFEVKITDVNTGAYKVTLVNNVLHTPGLNDELADETLALAYTITDNDLSVANGSLTIDFDDDAPTLAIADAPTTINESTTFTTGNWSLAAGADGVTSVKVTVNGVEQTLQLNDTDNTVTFTPVVGQPGTLVVKADGTWTYAANTVAADTPVSLTIAAVDGDGDTSTDTHVFTVKNVNQPLALTASATGLVEEEHGLPGGIDDVNSDNDTDTSPLFNEVKNTFSSTISVSGVTGAEGPLEFSFDAANIPTGTQVFKTDGLPLESEGANVLFHVSGNTLIGYVDTTGLGYNAADDREVFTLEITDATTGAYTFTLIDNLDHHEIVDADDLEKTIGIKLDNLVKITDTGDTNDSVLVPSFTINVIDDIPSAANDAKPVDEGTKSTVDVVFVVDVSTSMNATIADVPDYSNNRIGLARYSMEQLLETNTQIQNVLFTRFSGGASTSIWMSREDAIDYIQNGGNWNLSNSTDYDDALQSLINNFGDSTRPEGFSDKTVTYFLSDGEPNQSPNNNPGITGVGTTGDVSITEWETFVNNPGVGLPKIDQVYSIGIGAGAGTGSLNPIAYPNGDADSNGVENNVVVVADASGVTGLINTLQGFLGNASSITGNVLSSAGEGFGADGGYIQSITIDGDVYLNNGGSIAVDTDLGGTLTFYFVAVPGHAAGDWAYLAPANVNATTNETFNYVLVDGDGDNADADLVITVNNLNKVPTAGGVTGTVDDEGLAHGIAGNGTPVTGDVSGTATSAGGSLPGAGGDGALTWSFAGMVGAGVVGQENVNFTYVAGLLTATTVGGDRPGTILFTVTLNETSGAYTFNLVNPIKHLAGNSENGDIDLALTYTVSDTDAVADDATGTLTITLDDDAPVNFTAQSMTIANSGSATGSGALNFYESIGADGGSVVFTGSAANDGTNLTSGANNVTSGGKQVKLYGFGTGELTGRIDLDNNGSFETDVFKVTLNPSTSNEAADLYNVQFFRSLDDGAGFTITPTNFTNTSSAAFKVAQGSSDDDILVSAVSSPNNRVNGSNGGGVTSLGAGGGVEVGAGELLRFDFATGVVLNGESGNNDFNTVSGSLNHYNANGFAMTVDNAGGSSSIKIIAYDADNDKTLSGDLGDVKDTISAIYKNGILVPLGTLTASDGGYIVPATDGDIITVFTSSGFNRVEAIHAGGEAFALYNVGYLVAQTGDPVPLTFSVTATDGDGDQSTGTINVTAAPVNDPPVLSLFGGTVTSGNISDNFASGNYIGGSGWTSGWTETGDNNASGSGEIRLSSNVLVLGGSGNGASIFREANLLGKDTATLTFTFGESGTESDQDEELIVYFAADGTNYVEVARYDEGDADGTKTIPLFGPFDSDAKVMFTVTGTNASNDLFSVDNVNIAWTDQTAAPSEDYSAAYTENASGVSIASSPSITDVDDTNMVSAQIVLTNAKVGDTFTFAGLPAGITGALVAGAGTLTVNLTGNSSMANYQAAIAAVLFSSTAENADDRIINVTVNDSEGNSNTATTTIDYTAVNDAPAGANKTINLSEDVSYTFTAADFGFTDVDGNAFAGVVIDTLPGSGVLRLGTTAVGAGNFVTAAQIADGMLVFNPTDNTTSDSSFTFSVRDDGANGGGNVNEDQTPATMTLNFGSGLTDTANNDGNNDAYTAGLSGANFSIQDADNAASGGATAGDSLRIDTAGGTVFTALNFLRADNNEEIGWTSGGNSRTVTLLNQFTSGNVNGNDTDVETLTFQNGGTYSGYSLGNGAYDLDLDLTGDGSSDILAGTAATETINGGAGNDLLFGNGGDDILIGGQGSDLLVGGLGRDTFRWQAGDQTGNPTDVIADFTVGSGGDTLDLDALLSATVTNASSLATLDDYIQFSSSGGNTTVRIDHDGGGTFTQTMAIQLNGVDLTAGGTNSTQDILQNMINQGQLHV